MGWNFQFAQRLLDRISQITELVTQSHSPISDSFPFILRKTLNIVQPPQQHVGVEKRFIFLHAKGIGNIARQLIKIISM
ncbi:MAG: hypothetical protein R2861_06455 [Desulfobacterales bacterium]